MSNYNYDEEFIFRTEDIKPKDLTNIFVETKMDRDNLNYLKGKSPVLLEGSRGTGKTMLLRVAEKELDDDFNSKRELAVFVSFSKAIFVDATNEITHFRNWMFSKILFALKRKLEKKGVALTNSGIIGKYFNFIEDKDEIIKKLDEFIYILENSWHSKSKGEFDQIGTLFGVDPSRVGVLKETDYFKALVEDICEACEINRIVLLFDEACHNLIPLQQREFFTMFRDLRCPYISCKAAVYPGITSYGTFQSFHDAIVQKVERDITSEDYLVKMREIVKNQVDHKVYKIFEQSGENFNSLIYAASGNPRLLLKSLFIASEDLKSLKTNTVNSTIKNFYRTNIWNEHTKLGETYNGHKKLIDWGRWFVENKVLAETLIKNDKRVVEEKNQQTIYFAIHRDAPEVIKQAVRILQYSGIVSLHTEGTKVRTEVYDRYQINFGVVLASESKSTPINRYKEIITGLSVKLYTEYGINSPAYENTESLRDISTEFDSAAVLKSLLSASIDNLDITNFQCQTLKDAGFNTLEDVLNAEEKDLQRAYLIGPVKSRKIFNTAFNATIEYISG
ncbi:hypothetical protein PaecuDRAFT_2061 [Paenibacillus curdlanolyticus YK9]|uniref:RNA polymerase alpha subunit C-terminal domain-containing protein n=1 Tax=Paenibacillus curdlanolyticus YK9 TaxID=717606 RepID=E0I8T0_9BACL|nr:hypothetical protein [Paenibacillus curdlanolyticus]EFM10814.1 hypothetical protein PaecuDRAFT_2061 [Paenibacillus curdlanolyticus YK9]